MLYRLIQTTPIDCFKIYRGYLFVYSGVIYYISTYFSANRARPLATSFFKNFGYSLYLFDFNFHIRTLFHQLVGKANDLGSISRCMARQKEAHHTKADIVRTEGAEPKGTVIKSKPQLEKSIQGVPRKGAVERYVYPQTGIVLPPSCVFIFILEGFEEPDQVRNLEAPRRQGVGSKNVGNVRYDRFRSDKYH